MARLALLIIGLTAVYGDWNAVTFGTARKGVTLTDNPVLMYEHNAAGLSTVTQMWFTGTLIWKKFGDTRVSVIVDDDISKALNFTIGMLVGSGFDLPNEHPYGNDYIGYTALSGGIYSNLRIPFTKKIQVFAQLPSSSTGEQKEDSNKVLYFMLRGLQNVTTSTSGGPTLLSLGNGLSSVPFLPSTRLRFQKHENYVAPPNSYVSVYNSTASKGLFLMLTMQAKSGNMKYLEGRVRATIDGQEVILSSGTEDYFLSAQYFDSGPFFLNSAGCTYINRVVGHKFAAYRIHDFDPILWHNSYGMSWRVGDGHWNVTKTTTTIYAWAYEW